jgi:AcrR family transcriptional regulator
MDLGTIKFPNDTLAGMAPQVTTAPHPLPRGRHGLSRETVRASQRARLLQAMVEEAAERGYPAVTITHLVERARVARRTFYEHFENKETCFLAAYDYTAEQIIQPLRGAFEPVEDVLQRVGAYVAAALGALGARPELAQMLVIEVGAGGPVAISHRLAMHRQIADTIVELNAQTRARGIEVPEISPTRALAIVGALIEVMHAAIQDRGARCLPELREELTAIVAAMVSAPR